MYARYCSQVSDWLNGLAAWVTQVSHNVVRHRHLGLSGRALVLGFVHWHVVHPFCVCSTAHGLLRTG